MNDALGTFHSSFFELECQLSNRAIPLIAQILDECLGAHALIDAELLSTTPARP